MCYTNLYLMFLFYTVLTVSVLFLMAAGAVLFFDLVDTIKDRF